MASYISAHLSDRAERERVLPNTDTPPTTSPHSPQTPTLCTTFPGLTTLDNRPPRPVPGQPLAAPDPDTNTATDVHQRQHQTCTPPHPSLTTLTTTIELPTRSGAHAAGDPAYVGSVTITTTMTLPIPSSDQQQGCVAILSGQQKNAAIGSGKGKGKGAATVAFAWVEPFLWALVGVMGIVSLLQFWEMCTGGVERLRAGWVDGVIRRWGVWMIWRRRERGAET
ncbi:hypothetical protein BCR34DRAFT_577363 [Clohesyomyces aquaticus]|uniref:Uncharacterized protein n=1 Tax=Clohesyomyces aquaticus TaxID=1231657 RepID=A0A1Y1YK12_9PLEO|nr:hypothetical protein BCR34DRAFT_577363 [Clohesyomyces aquaticus]